MSTTVFANGNSIACKAADGKSVAAMPDVCLSPPSPPAGPIPIPYPNTGMASDTDDGSQTVQIGGQPVMLKDKSTFKTSTGDEAATKSLGMGVVTHQIQGKLNFIAWSMDVKIEGENVPRHLDLMGHNEASKPPNTPPWPYLDTMAIGKGGVCEKENKKIKKACDPEKKWKDNCPSPPTGRPRGAKPAGGPGLKKFEAAFDKYIAQFPGFAKKCKQNKCINARKCMLVPYKPASGCCKGQTGDHVIDAASFLEAGTRKEGGTGITGWKKYDADKAPVCCAEGPNQTTGTHGQLHTRRGVAALHMQDKNGNWSRAKATKVGAKAIRKTFPSAGCSEKCLKAQLDAYHEKCATTDPEKDIKANASMTSDTSARAAARKSMGVPSSGAASTR